MIIIVIKIYSKFFLLISYKKKLQILSLCLQLKVLVDNEVQYLVWCLVFLI